MDHFHEIEIEDGTSITELIQRFLAEGCTMSMARNSLLGITIPELGYVRKLQNYDHVETFTDAETEVNRRRTNYELLINKPHGFQAMFPMNTPSDTLDVMDTFNYIQSLTKKSGEMIFL